MTDSRTLAKMNLRALHHFDDATAFIATILDAFTEEGFDIRLQLTGMRAMRNGRRYVGVRSKEGGHQTVVIRRWGNKANPPIATIDFSEMERQVRRARTDADYDAAVRPIYDAARAVRRDADGA